MQEYPCTREGVQDARRACAMPLPEGLTMTCKHQVDPASSRPCFSLFIDEDRAVGRVHVAVALGEVDLPGDPFCVEFGPFDGAVDIIAYVAAELARWFTDD